MYTKISAALKPISIYLKFSAFKCARRSGRATGNEGRMGEGDVSRMGECYPSIPSRRERRIYAANAAVQRYRVCLFLRMGIKPRNVGANMAGAIFGG